jgi:tetrahydromethanopterin S-methyltransferase subunit F
MEEISEEQQAAMALKLMDNVKQLIIDTVVEDLRANGQVCAQLNHRVQLHINNTSGGSHMQMAVKRIVMDQMGKY